MDKIRVNETPVRTSENYNINDIGIDKFALNECTEFNNCKFINFDNESISISKRIDDYKLTYGCGNLFEEQVKKSSNFILKLDINKSTNMDNIISFEFNKNNINLVDNVEIIVKEGVSANVTFCYSYEYNTVDAYKCFHNGIIRTRLSKNSNLNITFINLLNDKTQNIFSLENVLDDCATLNYNIVDFGGEESISNYYSNLKGRACESNVNAIYLGKSKKIIDLNYISEINGEKSKVNMDVQGAISDFANKHFKGTIDFKRGAKGAKGDEKEFCMLLSKDAKSVSLPMLLCEEEDVVGNHSAASGKVDNKELFYIMSRGFTEQEAKILIVKASFNKVISNIQNEELKERVLSEVDLCLR